MLQPITLMVQDVNNSIVTVKTPDDQVWRLPLQAIHGTPSAGKELRLIVVTIGSEDAGQTAFAKAVLNELLNSPAS